MLMTQVSLREMSRKQAFRETWELVSDVIASLVQAVRVTWALVSQTSLRGKEVGMRVPRASLSDLSRKQAVRDTWELVSEMTVLWCYRVSVGL